MTDIIAAGTWRLGDRDVNRMGYGAMQLAGPGVFGPPRDRDAAIAVLRAAVAAGVNHIDTSDYYGPHVTNQLIRDALHPYPDNFTIVTKVGARRGSDASWIPARSPADLEAGVRDNLRNLAVEAIDVVNLRVGGMEGPEQGSIEAPFTALAELQHKGLVRDNLRNLAVEAIDVVNLRVGGMEGPEPGSIEAPFTALAELQRKGLVRHLGLSNVTLAQLEEAERIAPVACIQNHYNIVHRDDDAMIDALAESGIAYVPFFPLGGFSPIQSARLENLAAGLDATPMQVALAWLLQRARNILLIPGTSSIAHLEQNLAAANLALDAETVAELDAIGA